MRTEEVRLELPKFKLEFTSGLNDALKKLGMNDAFIENIANFNGIEIGKDLYIDEVIQKTYLNVDEAGTEAVAVTIVEGVGGCSPSEKVPKIYPMIVDRPFLFLLKNNKLPLNNEMLFISKIEEL